MKTRVTIELNDNAEDGIIEKSIVVVWCEQHTYHPHSPKREWWYKCEGYDGYALQRSLCGTAPIKEDIKEILKQIFCEAIDHMEEENGVAKEKHSIE